MIGAGKTCHCKFSVQALDFSGKSHILKVECEKSTSVTPKERPPSESCYLSKGGPLLPVLTVLLVSVKPLANVARDYICCDRHQKCEKVFHFCHPLSHKIGGEPQNHYITLFDKIATKKHHSPEIHGRRCFLLTFLLRSAW